MLRSHFLWKLYAGYVALILLTSLATGLLIMGSYGRNTQDELERTLRDKAILLQQYSHSLLRESPARPFNPEYAEDIKNLGQRLETRLTVIAADGTVLADSHLDPRNMENHRYRPELMDAEKNGVGTGSRLSASLKERMMYYALPVYEKGELICFVRTSIPLNVLESRLAELRWRFFVGAGIAVAASLILGLLLARRITAPIMAMTRVAGAMVGGDYSQVVRVSSSDEIGQLASAFNEMQAALRGRIQDITRQRNQLSAIFGSMVEGVVAVDQDERIVHINLVAAQLFGVAPADCVGRRTWEVLRNAYFTETVRQTIADDVELDSELVFVEKNRERIIVLLTSPLREGGGSTTGAVAMLHDITKMRQLEKMRREFVANASHEIKTPLTAIQGLAETMVLDEQMPAETRQHFLDIMLTESHRLNALVGDMLTLSRLESQEGLELDFPADIGSLVRAAVESFRPTAQGRGVELTAELPDEPVVVLGDHESLLQAVRNLIDNALKYSGGSHIGVRVFIEDDQCCIEVKDDGIGMKPEHHDKIFQRFYRVDKARSRELGGTGLGLAIVKHTAIAHGGSVELESHYGKGSRFTLYLPLRTSAA